MRGRILRECIRESLECVPRKTEGGRTDRGERCKWIVKAECQESASEEAREEIDARVNDFPYTRKRPRLSYIGEDKQHKSSRCACVQRTYAREWRARGGLYARVSALGRTLVRSLVKYSNDGRTYSFCTFNIARVSVEVFTATGV